VSTDIGVWIAAIATIGLVSFLFKENPLYRIIENMYVGISAGYALTVGYTNIMNLAVTPMLGGKYSLLIPIALGILLYARYIKRYAWVSKIPLGLIMGIGTGLAIRGLILSQVVNQIKACFIPLNSFDNIFMVLGTLIVLFYFFFAIEHKGTAGSVAKVGRWVMMIGFGASFAGTATGRISLFIGRLQYLLGNWLGVIK
jgi:hypothetical protein